MVFVHRGKRRLESQNGLAYLGVPLSRQVYVALPDGELDIYVPTFEQAVLRAAEEFQPDEIFATDLDGYDGHPDHQAAARVALRTGSLLAKSGLDVSTWNLQSNHTGELLVVGYRAQKLGAMTLHESQIQDDDLTRWGRVDTYTPLILDGEMYNRQPTAFVVEGLTPLAAVV